MAEWQGYGIGLEKQYYVLRNAEDAALCVNITKYAEEMLCTSREEHEALFGDAGDFEDDAKDDFEIDAMAAGLDVDELELMDPDDRAEALEDAGLDPDDYDFD